MKHILTCVTREDAWRPTIDKQRLARDVHRRKGKHTVHLTPQEFIERRRPLAIIVNDKDVDAAPICSVDLDEATPKQTKVLMDTHYPGLAYLMKRSISGNTHVIVFSAPFKDDNERRLNNKHFAETLGGDPMHRNNILFCRDGFDEAYYQEGETWQPLEAPAPSVGKATITTNVAFTGKRPYHPFVQGGLIAILEKYNIQCRLRPGKGIVSFKLGDTENTPHTCYFCFDTLTFHGYGKPSNNLYCGGFRSKLLEKGWLKEDVDKLAKEIYAYMHSTLNIKSGFAGRVKITKSFDDEIHNGKQKPSRLRMIITMLSLLHCSPVEIDGSIAIVHSPVNPFKVNMDDLSNKNSVGVFEMLKQACPLALETCVQMCIYYEGKMRPRLERLREVLRERGEAMRALLYSCKETLSFYASTESKFNSFGNSTIQRKQSTDPPLCYG